MTAFNIHSDAAPQLTTHCFETPTLQSVEVKGSLQGFVMNTTLRQRYINNHDDELEVIYTFPIAYDAVLLGLAVDINDQRLLGQVMAKQEATQRYEDAIGDGDTPVMLELASDGLYTANLGNLLPGESCVIELMVAQPLRLEQGQIRVAIPTTIAPRYGDAQAQGGVAPHQTTESSLSVSYGFDLQLDILGSLAEAKISSPSHEISQLDIEGGVQVALHAPAFLDRDFVLRLDQLIELNQALKSEGPGGVYAMVSVTPRIQAAEPRHLRVKVLVDCSGSMAGDSIAQTREALHALGKELRGSDMVSMTRFGSETQHVLMRMLPATDALIENQWTKAVTRIEADLGGTELEHALLRTFDIARPSGGEGPIDVLLITDGEVWDTSSSIQAARDSDHRIFALGVGSATAESLLRNLADQTGGACEFVSPNENMSAAMMRLFHRMRLGQASKLDIEWGMEPIWSSPLPNMLVPDEVAHIYAKLSTAPSETVAINCTTPIGQTSRQFVDLASTSTTPITRLVGAAQFNATADRDERAALALQHELVSEYTNYLLVYQRAEDAKAQGLPALQKTPQMLAAGWGGSSGVTKVSCSMSSTVTAPRIWFSHRRAARENALTSGGIADFEIPAFLRKQGDEEVTPSESKQRRDAPIPSEKSPPQLSPEAFITQIAEKLIRAPHTTSEHDWPAGPDELKFLVDELTDVLGDPALVYAILALALHRLITGSGRNGSLSVNGGLAGDHVRVLRQLAATAPHHVFDECVNALGRLYPGISIKQWRVRLAATENIE